MAKKNLATLLTLLDTHSLFYLSLFLLVFIPLYPKLPLAEVIPGYLVKVRIEDLLVLLTAVWWLIQSWRQKIQWRSPFIGLVSIYAVVGGLSILSAIFLLQTIPLEPLHIGKSVFHFVRYLEYFSVFFFMFSSLRTRKQARLALLALTIVVFLTTIYGIGQRYAGWPVFSTMNREFSKGALLSLGEDARVQSTFAGHYDMAAFLVLILPVLLVAIMCHPSLKIKIALSTVVLGGIWLLWLSGSKVAFAAVVLGCAATWLVTLSHKPRLFWSILLVGMSSSLLAGILAWSTLSSPQNSWLMRGLQTTQQVPVVSTFPPIQQGVNRGLQVLTQRQFRLDQALAAQAAQQPTEFSLNTIRYGLSLGIRFDTLWPQALRGMARNLLLGSGYGTLNKNGNSTFVEADSTDNNWLRIIGETGWLGLLSFLAILGGVWSIAQLAKQSRDWLVRSWGLGLIGGIVGLTIDALMIDVFVASKVAFTFWAVAGLTAKLLYLSEPTVAIRLEKHLLQQWNQRIKSWGPWLAGVVFLLFAVHRNPLVIESQILNLSADPSATSALTTVRCWIDHGQWELCRPIGSQPSPTSYLYGGYLLFLNRIWNSLGAFYYANVGLAVISSLVIYIWSRKVGFHSWIAGGLVLAYSLVLLHTTQLYVPVDANLAQTLFLVTGFSLWFQLKTHHRRWQALSLILIVASLHVFGILRTTDYFFSLVPLLLMGLSVCFKYLGEKLRISLSYRWYTSLVVGCVIALLGTSLVSPAGSTLLSEYRNHGSSWPIQSIKMINDYFSDKQQPVADSQQSTPYVMTLTNPYFADWYAQPMYHLLPVDEHQAFMSHGPAIWGDFDQSTPTHIAQSLVAQQQPVFVSDFGFDLSGDSQTIPSITRFISQFDLQTVALGCDETCNLYRLAPFSATVPRQLTTNAEYSFVIYNHHYNPQDKWFDRTMTALRTGLRDQLKVEPTLLITSGTTTQAQTLKASGQFATDLTLLTTTDNREKSTGDQYLQYATPHDVILFVSPNHDGYVSEQQQMAIYNSLLDIEQDPTIKRVIILTHRLAWLSQSQGYEPLLALSRQSSFTEYDDFFQTKLVPRLRRLSTKQILVVSGDLGRVPLDRPALFYDVDQKNGITYLAAAVNGLPNDVYLHFKVTDQGELEINAFSSLTQSLIAPADYGIEYWQTILPTLHSPKIVPLPPTPPITSLGRVLILSLAATCLTWILLTQTFRRWFSRQTSTILRVLFSSA